MRSENYIKTVSHVNLKKPQQLRFKTAKTFIISRGKTSTVQILVRNEHVYNSDTDGQENVDIDFKLINQVKSIS